MAEESVTVVKKSPKVEKLKAKSVRPKSKPTHPPTSEMVNSAIKSLKERGGSSLQAIKKYIASTYKVDAEKLSPFIKKYVKASVVSGVLLQTKGKGASGSFKLPAADKKVKKPATAKPKKTVVIKATVAKPKSKAVKPKAKVVKAKTPSPKAKAKTPMKKVAKSPIKKPKAPKPKKAAPKKK